MSSIPHNQFFGAFLIIYTYIAFLLTEGDDFSSAALDSVVIPIGSVDLETFPIDIAVNDDGAFEKAEYFVVNIDGAEDRVGILNATTTVTIQDNESMCSELALRRISQVPVTGEIHGFSWSSFK